MRTITANNTLPTDLFSNTITLAGIPTDLVGEAGAYDQMTTLNYDTAFTDPYGVVYNSPTPVWIYPAVTVATTEPNYSNGAYICPDSVDPGLGGIEEVPLYPLGKCFPFLHLF